MKKGFIGPIGDDLPSVIAVMLALGLFFSSVTYALNAYDQKIDNLAVLKGSLEISRIFLGEGLLQQTISSDLMKRADYIAISYGLEYAVGYDISCEDGDYILRYLVATWDNEESELRTLVLCIRRR